MSGSGREALLNVRWWSGVPPGCQGVVGNTWRALTYVREWSGDPPDFLEWLGGPPRRSVVVGRPSLKYGCGRKALPDVRERSGIVGRPTRMSGSGGEALPDVREALLYTL